MYTGNPTKLLNNTVFEEKNREKSVQNMDAKIEKKITAIKYELYTKALIWYERAVYIIFNISANECT